MSFTTTVKNEISGLNFSILENIAEISGFIRSSSKFSLDKIEISSENIKVAKRLYVLIKTVYGATATLESRSMANFASKKMYVVTVTSKVSTILSDISLIDENNNFLEYPKDYIVGSVEEMKAYLRGTFLARGSINDPKTSYHLELLYDNKYEAVFVQRLLNQFDMNSKILMRDVKYMVYIKEAEKISDFLKIINAPSSVLYYENVRIHKEQKNNTNRLNNCEQANTDKIIATATFQIKEIEYIDSVLGIDFLDEKLKETAVYRLKYPEASLSELSEIMTLETWKSVSKSGLNHRFRKIKEMYDKLIQSKNVSER